MTSRCNQLSQSCSVCAAGLSIPLHFRTGLEYLKLGISQKILSLTAPFMVVWSGQVSLPEQPETPVVAVPWIVPGGRDLGHHPLPL